MSYITMLNLNSFIMYESKLVYNLKKKRKIYIFTYQKLLEEIALLCLSMMIYYFTT
jgi:hypothetical protein